ncbi:MAG: GGDEF domain-containing protein [Myxococcota bacterium]
MWAPISPLEQFWLDAVAARDTRGLLDAWERYLSVVDPEGRSVTFRRSGDGWVRLVKKAEATASTTPNSPVDLSPSWRQAASDLAVEVESVEIDEAAWTILETAWPRVMEQERARALTTLDEVTGLFNARHLQYVLDQEVARCRRFGRNFSVLFVDLDHFKAVNDSLGHSAGTRLLVQVGQVLRRKLRSSDHAFRYGGDEFVICLIETERAQAMEAAERIRNAIEHWAKNFEDIRTELTASIGVACFPQDAGSAESLLEFADQRMYAAKRAGRNEVRTADLEEEEA